MTLSIAMTLTEFGRVSWVTHAATGYRGGVHHVGSGGIRPGRDYRGQLGDDSRDT